ncbi:hypothetical protein ACR720_17005, partial [Sphingomonas parapaucimobilis]|uniref:hypothetical protein n=1 Tax=Sphingomonas parapaucimobilis TaxID=28213 RepID=UPI0039EB14BF
MSNDFFDKIDAKLGEQKTTKVAKDNASDANRAFVKKIIPQLVTIAEGYAEKCRARGMSTNVSHSDYSVTFELRYKNGQKRTLVGGPDHDMNNRLAFNAHWPNDDGKRDVTPVVHPAATRDRPVLSRMSAGEATGGVNPARCCS